MDIKPCMMFRVLKDKTPKFVNFEARDGRYLQPFGGINDRDGTSDTYLSQGFGTRHFSYLCTTPQGRAVSVINIEE